MDSEIIINGYCFRIDTYSLILIRTKEGQYLNCFTRKRKHTDEFFSSLGISREIFENKFCWTGNEFSTWPLFYHTQKEEVIKYLKDLEPKL
jgi:hypothetical protein